MPMPSNIRVIDSPKGVVQLYSARPEDTARLRALRLAALADLPQAFAADYAVTEAETDAVWTERLVQYAEQVSSVIVVAEAENDLVGMCGLGRGHWPKTRHSGTIWGVYVRPEWRGLHLAQALLEGCLEWARAHAVVTAKLAVITPNTAAIRCYARSGFTVYGLEPQAIFYDGIYYDELLMARPV